MTLALVYCPTKDRSTSSVKSTINIQLHLVVVVDVADGLRTMSLLVSYAKQHRSSTKFIWMMQGYLYIPGILSALCGILYKRLRNILTYLLTYFRKTEAIEFYEFTTSSKFSKNAFTGILCCSNFAIKVSLRIPPQLKRVATLLCKF